MFISLRKLILTGVLVSSFSALANMEAKNSGFYLQGNLGYAMGVAPGGNFEQNTLGDAGLYGAAIGYKFDEHLRMDFGVDYRDGYENKFSVDDVIETDEDKLVGHTDTQTTKVRSWSSMVSFYYDIVETKKITPYVMLGAGVARNTSDSRGEHSYHDGEPSDYYSFSRGTNINFAWKIGAGARYSINQNMAFDLHYQYVDLGDFRTGNIGVNGRGKRVHPNLEGKLQSHEILFGSVYKF